jgi:hypothetical protein
MSSWPLFLYAAMLASSFTRNSCKIHVMFTHKILKLCYTRGAASCCALGLCLLDKSADVAYNVINPACTDKGKPIERWGRKATGLR